MTVLELPGPPERYLTKRQVAERLGFSIRWVEDQVQRRELPAHTIGGQRRFLWSEIEAWIRRRDH